MADEQVYVFGLPWWPFDGAVTAALIALIGTLLAMWFNGWRFRAAEKNQGSRHSESLRETERVSERERLSERLILAMNHAYSGEEARIQQALIMLQAIRSSRWLDVSDRRMIVDAIDYCIAALGGGAS